LGRDYALKLSYGPRRQEICRHLSLSGQISQPDLSHQFDQIAERIRALRSSAAKELTHSAPRESRRLSHLPTPHLPPADRSEDPDERRRSLPGRSPTSTERVSSGHSGPAGGYSRWDVPQAAWVLKRARLAVVDPPSFEMVSAPAEEPQR
jgi:hypothetical protein